jgi:RAB6A-GEF complex partner protein 1
VVLAHLTRTPLSLQDHGENKAAQWSPDGSSIVIQACSSSTLAVFHSLELDRLAFDLCWCQLCATTTTIQTNAASTLTGTRSWPRRRHTAPANTLGLRRSRPDPGQNALVLHFSCIVLHPLITLIHSISPRHSCIMFSTANPSTVQRISWPNLALKHSREQILTASGQPITAHDTWEVNATAFPWLLDHEG